MTSSLPPAIDGAPDITDLVDSWLDGWTLELRAQGCTAGTIRQYVTHVRMHLAWCAEHRVPARLDARTVKAHIADMLEVDDDGKPRRSALTAQGRLAALKRFSSWCAEEGEIPSDELDRLRRPRAPEVMRPPLSREDVRALLATCDSRTFLGRRDDAIIRLLLDSAGRAREIMRLRVDDVALLKGHALVHGKGARDRLVPINPATQRALDRYIRVRRRHPLANEPALWLGGSRRTFGYYGLWCMIKRRAALAGIPDVHPHRFRRTAADWWLESGGTESGLMAVGGWRTHEMMRHYTQARANVRALDEAHRLNTTADL